MTRRQVLVGGAVLLASGAEAAQDLAWSRDWKILDGSNGKEVRWRDLDRRLPSAQVVFVGEQHDDPETHRVELFLLQALHQRLGNKVSLAMEMFERDHQKALTDYVTGTTNEDQFTKAVTLWKNYPTDYRPMIEFAREKRLSVYASNAPLRLVRQVSKGGLPALEAIPPEDRALLASFVTAPSNDEYARRFAAVMGGGSHGDGEGMDKAMIQRFYEAQCVRDDTMADTLSNALSEDRTLLHINGSFHSDAGLGTVGRLLWRKPRGTRITLIKVVPFKDKMDWEPLRNEADYLIFVPDKRPAPKTE